VKAARLQKVMARAGVGSRRASENLIRDGRVTVNGRQATLGMRADPAVDEIRVDGVRLPPPDDLIVVALNKPAGVVSSLRSQDGGPTVRDLVPLPQRLFPVGRLDMRSEGLILLTNDGGLANRLAHPRYEHEKEYRVLLDRVPDAEQLQAWQQGVVLPDGRPTLPAKVWMEGGSEASPWVRVVLRQGLKRQIRLTARTLGLKVRRLVRTRFAGVDLGDLEPGAWRKIDPRQIALLQSEDFEGEARPIGHPSTGGGTG
jgi:23S rRNA pseudouridine2605 synthase